MCMLLQIGPKLRGGGLDFSPIISCGKRHKYQTPLCYTYEKDKEGEKESQVKSNIPI